MSNHFVIVSSPISHQGLSVILNTEGISYNKNLIKDNLGVSLIEPQQLDKDFSPPPNTKLFICLADNGRQQINELIENLFSVVDQEVIEATKATLQLKEPFFNQTLSILNKFGFESLTVPLTAIRVYELDSKAQVLAEIKIDGQAYPALIEKDGHFLSTFDLGESFLSLLTENYFERQEERKPLSSLTNLIYKALPYSMRIKIYRQFLKRIQKQTKLKEHFTTQSPIDPTGWALNKILIELIDSSIDLLPRVWKWPANKKYVFCFTHDIEPRKFAYFKGLPKLLDTLKELDLKSSVSIVAQPPFSLPEKGLNNILEQGHEVISHGLHHNETFNVISSQERAFQIEESLKRLSSSTGSKVIGFRAPWLQRTLDLNDLLQKGGVAFDSSYVDADTSLKKAWHGKGISFNFPFKLFNIEKQQIAVWELPLTGPQDMEPYFSGLSFEESKFVFKQKHDWIKEIDALYVFLVHAGVYGAKDSRIRMNLLRYLARLVQKQDAWVAKLSKVAQWCSQRSALKIEIISASTTQVNLVINNNGEHSIHDFSLAIPTKSMLKKALITGKEVQTIENSLNTLIPIGQLKANQKIEVSLTL